ncbi:MAG: VTT domain-containing protein [Fimbriimonadaceae bacterium]|nr:VTT domain-containing protein [Fimbriimonadaceae bacterium]
MSLPELIQRLDESFVGLIHNGGVWLYAALFLIGFCQTGLIVGPLVPGSTLMFMTGVIARTEASHVRIDVCLAAAWLGGWAGGFCHYAIGAWLGPKLFARDRGLLSRERLAKTREFFDRHGKGAAILSPSLPFLRTFLPLVAGSAKMPLGLFAWTSLIGVGLWAGPMLLLGYLAGNIPYARQGVVALALLAGAGMVGKVVLQMRKPVVRSAPDQSTP